MTEKLLHYIWRFQYFNRTDLLTTEGERVEIFSPGTINQHQGPDFTNARIRIGQTTFAGNVELHLHTSDWFRHQHQNDANYNNVILHVVFRHDGPVNASLPVLELEPRISSLLLLRYEQWQNARSFIPCAQSIAQVRDLVWVAWKERLLAERLLRKSGDILNVLEKNNGHWEETFWQQLARGFGLLVNADAFEAVAASVPVSLLAKHKSSIQQIEALLLGQANLLQGNFDEEYPKLLQREYCFLQKKYNLKPVPYPVHFLRMRPPNFPTIRLAQLAMLVHTSAHLFSRMLEAEKAAQVQQWFQVMANDYWHYHYRLDEPAAFLPKKTGKTLIASLLINTVVPVLFAYGQYHGQEAYKGKALRWLDELQAEANSIIKGFAQLSVPAKTAFDSQALLELKNHYCSQKRCLECSVGNSLLRG